MFDLNKKEKPFTSFGGFGGGGLGLAGGAIKLSTYVDDVFSTFLYDGTGSAQTITNGIDLAGEGGLVWIKNRNSTFGHVLNDTARGVGSYLSTNNSNAADTDANTVTAFNSNGFTLGTSSTSNGSGYTEASWSFRKAPGWCDIVTFTGSGSGTKTVSHSLGSVPGMIIVKGINSGSDWSVYHRKLNGGSSPENYYVSLNHTDGESNAVANWGGTAPTATQFTVGGNANGSINYVAYIFAHDDAQFGTGGDESIISCGSYTGNGSTTGPVIDLGFEPQWLLVKRTNAARGWIMGDIMRGAPVGSNGERLFANTNGSESNDNEVFTPTPTGFTFQTNSAGVNGSGDTYIYMAIRRPNKPPTAAIEVFAPVVYAGTGSAKIITTGFPVDLNWANARDNAGDSPAINDRLRGNGKELYSSSNGVESNVGSAGVQFDFQTTLQMQSYRSINSKNYFAWNFKRASGFFDIVGYSGNATAGTSHNHNLEAVPEFIMCKSYLAGGGAGWWCYHKDLSTNYAIRMDGASNGSVAEQGASNYWNSSTHSATTFTLGDYGDINGSGKTFISYLFATLADISKVGSYTGTGNAINVNCGFSSGARFILIKRKDASGDWFVYDSARGIVSGNDPYVLPNTGNAEVTNTDYIDPLSSGFTVTSSAPAALNTSGGTYIFLAIA